MKNLKKTMERREEGKQNATPVFREKTTYLWEVIKRKGLPMQEREGRTKVSRKKAHP